MTAIQPIKVFGRLIFGALMLAVMMIAPTGSANAKNPILTKKTVEKFIDSYPDVKALAEDEATMKGTEIAGSGNQLAAVLKIASDDKSASKVDATVRKHGFSDARQWLSIGRSVSQAYVHIKHGKTISKVDKKLEKAIRKINKQDFLSDKQKAKLIRRLRKRVRKATKAPPPENVAVVKPMMGELDLVLK